MKLNLRIGFVALLVILGFSVASCDTEPKKPEVVKTQSESPYSSSDRKTIYTEFEVNYAKLIEARKDYLKGSMLGEYLAKHQANFQQSVEELDVAGITPEMLVRLKKIAIGEEKASAAFQKSRLTCNSDKQIAQICTLELSFFNESINRYIKNYKEDSKPIPK